MPAPAAPFIEAALSALERAVQHRGSDLRNVQLATTTPDGAPDLRTLVLRAVAWSPASAEMHTDARAGKVRDIGRSGQVALLAWSVADQLQLRFRGTAELHQDDAVARSRWDGLSADARSAYGLRSHPGDPVADPEDRAHLPPDAQFRQFAVILVSLAEVDVLRLAPGNRQTRGRARFTASGMDAEWIGA